MMNEEKLKEVKEIRKRLKKLELYAKELNNRIEVFEDNLEGEGTSATGGESGSSTYTYIPPKMHYDTFLNAAEDISKLSDDGINKAYFLDYLRILSDANKSRFVGHINKLDILSTDPNHITVGLQLFKLKKDGNGIVFFIVIKPSLYDRIYICPHPETGTNISALEALITISNIKSIGEFKEDFTPILEVSAVETETGDLKIHIYPIESNYEKGYALLVDFKTTEIYCRSYHPDDPKYPESDNLSIYRIDNEWLSMEIEIPESLKRAKLMS